MKKLGQMVLGATIVLGSSVLAGSGWVSLSVVDVGSHQENGGEYFVSINHVINPENCTQNVSELRWRESAPNAKGMYATMLAATMAGRPVVAYVYGCTPSGWPQLWGVKMPAQ